MSLTSSLSRIVPSRVGGNDGRDDRAICALLVRVPRLAQGERLPYRRFHVDLFRLHQSDVAGRVAPVIGATPCAGPMMLRTVRPLLRRKRDKCVARMTDAARDDRSDGRTELPALVQHRDAGRVRSLWKSSRLDFVAADCLDHVVGAISAST